MNLLDWKGVVLLTELSVVETTPVETGGVLASVWAVVSAVRGDSAAPEPVLDWGFVALVA